MTDTDDYYEEAQKMYPESEEACGARVTMIGDYYKNKHTTN